MPEIIVRKNEPFENALRRFKKQCQKTGILREIKEREHYDKPSIRRKLKAKAAKKKKAKGLY